MLFGYFSWFYNFLFMGSDNSQHAEQLLRNLFADSKPGPAPTIADLPRYATALRRAAKVIPPLIQKLTEGIPDNEYESGFIEEWGASEISSLLRVCQSWAQWIEELTSAADGVKPQ